MLLLRLVAMSTPGATLLHYCRNLGRFSNLDRQLELQLILHFRVQHVIQQIFLQAILHPLLLLLYPRRALLRCPHPLLVECHPLSLRHYLLNYQRQLLHLQVLLLCHRLARRNCQHQVVPVKVPPRYHLHHQVQNHR